MFYVLWKLGELFVAGVILLFYTAYMGVRLLMMLVARGIQRGKEWWDARHPD
jgi:hypothetical protein